MFTNCIPGASIHIQWNQTKQIHVSESQFWKIWERRNENQMWDINFPFSKYINTHEICDRLYQKHLKIILQGFFGWFFLWVGSFWGWGGLLCFGYYFIAPESLSPSELREYKEEWKNVKNNNNYKDTMSDFVCLLNCHLSRYHSVAPASI